MFLLWKTVFTTRSIFKLLFFLDEPKHLSHVIPHCFSVRLCSSWLKRSCSDVFVLPTFPFVDKLTKEEEEIYKLQHDLERTAISQQQSKKIPEVSSLCLTQYTVSSWGYAAGTLFIELFRESSESLRFYMKLYYKCSFRAKYSTYFTYLKPSTWQNMWVTDES